jgi:hypothetical protein
MTSTDGKITVENVNVPGHTTRVSKAMYDAMKQAMWKVIPSKPPGLTQNEIREAVVPHLPTDLFPGGAKAGWWAKTVQLDQEAKRTLVREGTVLPNHSLEPWKNTRISDGSRPARRFGMKESWPGRSPLRFAPGCFAKLEAVRRLMHPRKGPGGGL